MTARDCDRLVALSREYLAVPDATINALETERRLQISAIESLRNGLSHLKADDLDAADKSGESPDPLDAEIETLFKNDPGAPVRILETALARINARFDTLIADARLAPYQRAGAAAPPSEARAGETLEERMASRFVNLVLPVMAGATTRFTQTRVQVQLLGVHGAVRRFRWERDKLPDALADLRLPPELSTDPYTGTPLVYQKTSETAYALSSAGPPERDQNSNIVPGKRVPILLPAPLPPAAATTMP
jgi:hypothetical protein